MKTPLQSLVGTLWQHKRSGVISEVVDFIPRECEVLLRELGKQRTRRKYALHLRFDYDEVDPSRITKPAAPENP